MAPHLLVTQLHFARSEFARCLEGVSAEDGLRRILPMNSLGWIVGHLTNQEHRYWVMVAQGQYLFPELNDLVGTGKPASTPPLAEMWAAWKTVTESADRYLETLTPQLMQNHLEWKGQPLPEDIGTMLMRNIYHYWYHTGEAAAIRQCLGHTDLPQFVGDLSKAGYHPEI